MIKLTEEQNDLLSKLVTADKKFERVMSEGFTILNEVSNKYDTPALKLMPSLLSSLLEKSINNRTKDIDKIEESIKDLRGIIKND